MSTSASSLTGLTGRLELTWTNKGQRLLALDDGRTYAWVAPSDHRVAEVRLLDSVASCGQTNADPERAKDNLLIEGDALNALTSLLELPEFRAVYAGKVKLAYLDPPFNTQQAFEHYDDALEHSVWLTMMRDRLVQIKELLHPSGSVWVHLDDSEVHHCRCVLDEVFGARNYVASIAWRSSDNSNNDAKKFSTDHNTLLVYSPVETWESVRVAPELERVPHFTNPDNDPRGPWFDGNPVNSPNPRKNLTYEIESPSGYMIPPPPNGWRWSRETLRAKMATGEIRFSKDERGIRRRTYLADHGGLPASSLWTDLNETGHNRQAKSELKRLRPGIPTSELFATPKPERLIRKILEVATSKGDIVLDCFAGSFSTAAVAHKMGRRWVGIERSPSAIAEYGLPRLSGIVAGTDDIGVTSLVGWSGGGGFRHLAVHRSMFEGDNLSVTLSDWAVQTHLSEAIAAQIGIAYDPQPPFAGRKGRTRLCVIDGMVNTAVVEVVIQSLAMDETVAIYGTAIDPTARDRAKDLRPGSTVRKIPASILARYRISHAPSRDRLGTQLTLPVTVAEHS